MVAEPVSTGGSSSSSVSGRKSLRTAAKRAVTPPVVNEEQRRRAAEEREKATQDAKKERPTAPEAAATTSLASTTKLAVRRVSSAPTPDEETKKDTEAASKPPVRTEEASKPPVRTEDECSALRPVAPRKDEGNNNIRVAVRIRPFNSRELAEKTASGETHGTAFEVWGTTSVVVREQENNIYQSEYTRGGRTFNYDQVFNAVSDQPSAKSSQASQEDIFEAIGTPILENALDAYNGCLLAYGQTGSGKSHSVLGDPTNETDKGLLPRACERLFGMVDRRRAEEEAAGRTLQAAILASYMEIYQEKLFDLLVNTRNDLQVRMHKDLGAHVPGLTQTPVSNIQDVQELLDFGAKNRAVGATSMNATSSRSHAVFTVDLRITITMPGGVKDLQSKINFVDLAGSEKQKKTGASGERFQEGVAINMSLSALSRVIQALSGAAGKSVPPFRESKLTILLKDALSGNSRTVLLACISPSTFNVEESISTLEFASRCKMIKTNAKKNEQDKQELIESLTAEKDAIASQLEMESQRRQLLQEELQREVEISKKNQDLVESLSKEKMEIDRELKELEKEATQSKQEQMFSKTKEEDLQKAEEELSLRKKQQEQLQLENERVRQEDESKSQELLRLQEEREELRSGQRLKEEEMQRLRQDKERQVAELEKARLAALQHLEQSAQKQEEEHRQWIRKHEETARHARDLEEQLQKQAEADHVQRERLEKEREKVKLHLEQEREEKERRVQEVERLRREQEESLKVKEESRQQLEGQLQELRERQKSEQSSYEQVMAEKERQAQELQQLREEQAAELERRRQLEEQEKAAQEQIVAELRSAEAQKQEQLEQEGELRRKAVSELQDRIAQIQIKEQEQRQRVEEGSLHAADLQNQLQEEVTRREKKVDELQHELKGLQDLSDSWKLERRDLEDRAHQQKRRRQDLLEELGIKGLMDDEEEDHNTVPRLVNLNADPSLDGCLVYYLPVGETRIGKDSKTCRICISGVGVADEVCAIRNDDHESLTVRALPGGFVRVNGVQVSEGETAEGSEVVASDEGCTLVNGDRVAIGRAYIFRVAIPRAQATAEAKDSEEKFQEAMQELQANAKIDERWRQGVDDAVMIVKQHYNTEMANKLLQEASVASDAVAEANSLLQDIPPSWCDGVTHYELSVLFGSGGPPNICVVAKGLSASGPERRTSGQGGEELMSPSAPKPIQESKGIWDATRFKEQRLHWMQQAHETFRVKEVKKETALDIVNYLGKQASRNLEGASGGGEEMAGSAPDATTEKPLQEPNWDDWEQNAWAEVTLERYNRIMDKYVEVVDKLEAMEKDKQKANEEENPGLLASLFGKKANRQPGEQPAGIAEWLTDLFGGPREPAASPSSSTPSSDPRRDFNRAKSVPLPGGPTTARAEKGRREAPVPRKSISRTRVAPRESVAMQGSQELELSTMDDRPARIKVKQAVSKMDQILREDQNDLSSQIVVRTKRPAKETQEEITIRVPNLFDGKLGVRLKMECLRVTGFDVPKAQELGWAVGDDIIAIGGKPVKSKDEFKQELVQARGAMPIVFTVMRTRGRGNDASESPSKAVVKSVSGPGRAMQQRSTQSGSPDPSGAAGARMRMDTE